MWNRGADDSPQSITACFDQSSSRNRIIRYSFWTFGLISAFLLTYTTRHFINGDVVAYFDMAEALRTGGWKDAINLTYAPGYSALLAVLEYLFDATQSREIWFAKILNFILFVAAMGACDVFVQRMQAYLSRETGSTLPLTAFSLITYSTFLLSAIAWVRLQVISPDFLVFIFILLSVNSLIAIREKPCQSYHFALLGIFLGLGYLCKTFFFPFSAVFFIMAAFSGRTLGKAIPRVTLGMAAMLIVSSPALVAFSHDAGRFSYGEAGTYNYAYFVAGEGTPISGSRQLFSSPQVLFYDYGSVGTYPGGCDPARRQLGVKPVFDIRAQLKAISESLEHLVGRVWLPFGAVFLWLGVQLRLGKPMRLSLLPLSLPLVFLCIGLAGIGMYSLVVMEIRYVAPFMFLVITGLALLPRYHFGLTELSGKIIRSTAILAAFFAAAIGYSVMDQTIRSLYPGEAKPSYRQSYEEAIALADFMKSQGISHRAHVAIFFPPQGNLYWARSAQVRLVGEICGIREFFAADSAGRQEILESLTQAGIVAVVGKGKDFQKLIGEGWLPAPGTDGYYLWKS